MSKELIEANIEDLVPNTFIAVDVEGSTVRFVGVFEGWTKKNNLILRPAGAVDTTIIERDGIEKVWWAPMGYRA